MNMSARSSSALSSATDWISYSTALYKNIPLTFFTNKSNTADLDSFDGVVVDAVPCLL